MAAMHQLIIHDYQCTRTRRQGLDILCADTFFGFGLNQKATILCNEHNA